MAVENLYGSLALDGYYDPTTEPGQRGDASAMGGRVKVAVETVEVSAAASATSTYYLAEIPSNARILPQSTIYYDDLASTGAPTVDVGLFATDDTQSMTDDDDALAANIDVATAAGSTSMPAGIADYGKKAWELIASQTVDPGGKLAVKATIKDAATNDGGTITLVLYYSVA